MRGHVGQLELQLLKAGQRRAELFALGHVARSRVAGALGCAHGAGGDIDAAAVEPLHGELEAFALGAEDVLRRHFHVFESARQGGLASRSEERRAGKEWVSTWRARW